MTDWLTGSAVREIRKDYEKLKADDVLPVVVEDVTKLLDDRERLLGLVKIFVPIWTGVMQMPDETWQGYESYVRVIEEHIDEARACLKAQEE